MLSVTWLRGGTGDYEDGGIYNGEDPGSVTLTDNSAVFGNRPGLTHADRTRRPQEVGDSCHGKYSTTIIS
jgi:hypothetical protein